MLPIALLPVAGLLLGIGGSFSNTTMLETYGLTRSWDREPSGTHCRRDEVRRGYRVRELPILFAMGIAIGMAKRRRKWLRWLRSSPFSSCMRPSVR